MFQQKLSFKNSLGFSLSAIFEGETEKAPLVILCHGYESSKDRMSTASLAKELVERGLAVFRFDFTGCGESEGKIEDLTPLQGLDDLKSAVAHSGRKDLGLYGASFGGHVSLMYAIEIPVAVMALRAPVSDYAWVVEKEPSGRRKSWVKSLAGLDLYKEVKKISAPVLIVHGDADETVPVAQSKKLFDSLQSEKRLEIIKGQGHRFGKSVNLEKTNELIADFFGEKLK